ncbi:HAMP domain-containing histidine kinase [Chryseobacterium sp. SN22]|uniref:sensor histidine kinase n=1 Tax=Chryseobacterium sp. SN22 TaxID=2606431 RepID=UPI0011EF30B6|nr:HAMP domain-containing sensor histidine kinase [Chryseobacterium sp. SN22]KAA0129303.1 HAMP domain-containing histidine kinase [Chryseobacterium sp. SN22]
MTLRNRFTLISSLSFGIVSVITFVVIFIAYYDSTKLAYFDRLKNTALISAIYYLEKDELPKPRHTQIKKEYNHLIQKSQVAVYNPNNVVTFGMNLDDRNIRPQDLQKARANGKVQFMADNHFYYGIYYPDNQGNFVVFVKSSSDSFSSQVIRLLIIMLSVLAVGLLAIYLLSRYLSKVVYKPVSEVIRRINSVSETDISQAITSTNTHDEIDELIKSYNRLLGRIGENMLLQQNFINYVSHEFKTPLAAISGSLEVFARKERSPQEYREVAEEVLENVYEIESILNNLLLMSGLSKIEKPRQLFRIDEVVWKVHEKLQNHRNRNHAVISVKLEVTNFSLLEYHGNETLLYLALYNIVENALKYSDNSPVTIRIYEKEGHLAIDVEDSGVGIAPEDLLKITETFYRGKNVGAVKGSGIGLSLSESILRHHGIEMSIGSALGKGTTVSLVFNGDLN